ncbi:MAG TPA: hypothetical protein VFL03_11725 [Candidatus Limnocylindrales bacterium]|nr:hypothetical protein [Candidatus Limnocylindrales bacterium]
MTDQAPGEGLQPQPPAPPEHAPRLVYDGAFIGPVLPPGAPAMANAASTPPVSDAVLALPLGTRQLVGAALDLLTRQDSGLRGASFYIGFFVLVTVAPLVMLIGLIATTGATVFDEQVEQASSLDSALFLGAFIALGGYFVAGIEARLIATAVIGGRAEGRPLRLRESIALARRRFWRMVGASLVVGFTTLAISLAIQLPLGFALGNVEAINYGIGLIVGTLVGAPFVYVAPGIVLGEVGTFEAIQRSMRLALRRKRLAIVVAMFGILSQFIVLFGVSIGADVVVRLVDGTGIAESFPPALVIPLSAVLVFAFGTLLFLVESITAAPAVYAFEALTHYTHGLQVGRDRPANGTAVWSPWVTPGLAIAAILGVLSVVAAILALPG